MKWKSSPFETFHKVVTMRTTLTLLLVLRLLAPSVAQTQKAAEHRITP